MLYFPLFQSQFPSWMPFWGGERFEFFSPVFNVADASISLGVIIIFIFQSRFFKKHIPNETPFVDSTKVVSEAETD
jgi:signal peptidase II